jgi:single-strand DNA-binding protein
MASLNKVLLIGHLTKDPELRYIANGSAVANLRMAINRTYKLVSGEQKEDVCYVTVVVWRKQAEAAGEYLKKGDPLFVEGRLQSRSWETEDGQKRNVLEVVAERIQFLSKAKNSGNIENVDTANSADIGSPEVPTPSDEDIPF